MKKVLVFILTLFVTLPMFSQKLSKEEKAALAKEQYESAIQAINDKAFVLIPSSYIDENGIDQALTDNSIFISYEKTKMYMQGLRVCDNNYTNVAEVTEYLPKIDKKGNLKLRIVVMGRMIKGTYTISMRRNGNIADVIFAPANGTTRKFQGPIVPLNGASYIKRANPM